MTREPCILIVPGLRDAVAQHWQTLLEARLRAAGRAVAAVPPIGREDLDCATRVAAIERTAIAIAGPLIIVAHSGGCITVAHWARQTKRTVAGTTRAVAALSSAILNTVPARFSGSLISTARDAKPRLDWGRGFLTAYNFARIFRSPVKSNPFFGGGPAGSKSLNVTRSILDA